MIDDRALDQTLAVIARHSQHSQIQRALPHFGAAITWRAVHSGSDRGRDLGPRRDSARLGVPIN
jgi:hypothetical protein